MKRTEKEYIYYFQIVDIWSRLCTEHSTLFDQTCTEYSLLIENNLDELEIIVAKKEATIQRISLLEQLRMKVISTINESLSEANKISSIMDLMRYTRQLEEERSGDHLKRFNEILVDIIEKIQQQNRRNHMFITKANETLQDIRNGLVGKNSYSTYTSQGARTKSTSEIFRRSTNI